MKVLDLFSGIGGMSLGLERAGMTTVAFCETDEFCCRILRKHWPDVPIYGDIKELRGEDIVTEHGAIAQDHAPRLSQRPTLSPATLVR